MNDINEQNVHSSDEDVTVLSGNRLKEDDDATIISDKRRPPFVPAAVAGPAAPMQVIIGGADVEIRRTALTNYLLLPLVLLTVTLLGGLRLSSPDSSFLFVPPPLFCLIFAVMLLVLFSRAGILNLNTWFSQAYSFARNARNGWLLFTLFAASSQIFNSLLPEQGVPFWVVGFCFFWTLWNNLFADFDPRRLLKSLGALFGLAFVVKYLILANLAAPEGGSWLSRMIENPGKETFTWLLDIPRYSAGTGYIQFVTAALFFLGLLLLPIDPNERPNVASK